METIVLAAAICLPLAAITFGAGLTLGGVICRPGAAEGAPHRCMVAGLVIIGLVVVFVAGASF